MLTPSRVGSHRLQAQKDHHIDREDIICRVCTLVVIKSELHFIFHCPIYYENRGRFYCLFRECSSMTSFFSYTDQRCLALYLWEAMWLSDHTQLLFSMKQVAEQLITDFFSPLPSRRGVKRPSNTSTTIHSRVKAYICVTF